MENTKEDISKLEGLTVLVAEDEHYNFVFLREILAEYKINVIRANNGMHAIKICNEDSDIDLILMDVRMPVMDGYEATKRIKETSPNLPIIIQTAYALESDRKKALQEGCDDYIAKPIRRNDLVSKLIKNLKLDD